MTPIPECQEVTPERFRDIRRAGEPVVLRGLVADWPIVRAEGGAAAWLRARSADLSVRYMRAPPEIEGRLHYSQEASGRNFERIESRLGDLLDALDSEASQARPAALALQGMPAAAVGDFVAQHPMPLLPAGVPPRLWIGNAAKVAIHHDPSENIACVAAGRRRFTLFPPEQVGNLYMGPFHETPAGVQVSLVHLTDPDLDRYPRFTRALQAAMTADLGPGDALYIPYQWYHHVEALSAFNVLVNYWWDAAPLHAGSPWDAMMHAMMSLRLLPADQRRAWRAMFDHYVFQTDGDPAAHLPPQARGVLGPATPQSVARLREGVIARLKA